MKKILLAAAFAVASSGFAATSANAALSCPPGVTNPAYCTTVPDPTPDPPVTDPTPTAPTQVVSDASKVAGKALASPKAATALLAGKTQTVALKDPEPGTYQVAATQGKSKTSLLTGTVTVKADAKSAKLKVKLTKAGKSYLKKQKAAGKKSVTLTQKFSFKAPGKKPVTKTTKLKFKLK